MSVAVETAQAQPDVVANLQTTITGKVFIVITIYFSWRSLLGV